ncbi:hypothetical protein ACQY0O_008083 [Thecaphora frezii]
MMLPSLLSPLALAVTLVASASAVNLTIPTLMQCEPATFQIEARGNVTIGAKDASRMVNVMRAFVPVMGSRNWTWCVVLLDRTHIRPCYTLLTSKVVLFSALHTHTHTLSRSLPPFAVTREAVELPENGIAVFLVTDFFGSSPFDIAQHYATAVVGPSPTNNTACLPPRYTKHLTDDLPSSHAKSIEVPVIAGVLVGFLCLLLGLVMLVMVRRRRERLLAEKCQNEAGDLQDESRHLVPPDYTPAGGGYMAKLVPGLQINSPQPAAPLPSPSTRRPGRSRGFRTWRRSTSGDDMDGELPTYGESQKQSRLMAPRFPGTRGQAFELRERLSPIRLHDAPVTSEMEIDNPDDGDGWGGRNSIFGSISASRPTTANTSLGGSIMPDVRSLADDGRDQIEMMEPEEDEPPTSPLIPRPNDQTAPRR